MSGYKTIAVLGAFGGNGPVSASVGYKIAQALLERGAKVVALGRKESEHKESVKTLKAAGATISFVDYSQPQSLENALQGVDVVVSALAVADVAPQLAAVDAAKAAGVKLFLPSEFGLSRPHRVGAESPFIKKQEVVDRLEKVGLSYTLIWTSVFSEFTSFAFSPKEGKVVTITGDGKTKLSATALRDVGAYVAYILTAVDPTKYTNKGLNIASTIATGDELFEIAKSKRPELEVQYESVEDAKKRWEDKKDFFSFIRAAWAEGRGNTGGVDNGLAPDVQWTDISKFL